MDYTKATLDKLLKTTCEEKEELQHPSSQTEEAKTFDDPGEGTSWYVSSACDRAQNTSRATEEAKVCEYCGFRTPWKKGLKKHIRINHEPQKCEDTKIVIPISKGQRTCTYENCKKTFVSSSMLKRHMLVHIGEKRYSCHLCNYKSAWKDNFTRHLKTHTRR